MPQVGTTHTPQRVDVQGAVVGGAGAALRPVADSLRFNGSLRQLVLDGKLAPSLQEAPLARADVASTKANTSLTELVVGES